KFQRPTGKYRREKHQHDNAEIIVNPDAGHAFNADYRPTYSGANPHTWR
ncbi:hypothetical protein O5264_29150, partial [Escherichia coli]|nr:hypothetical protein [Escherichia coli]